MDLRERFNKFRDSLFESDSIPPPPEERSETSEEPLLLEQAESSEINGDINSAAQQMLEEQLSRVTSADAEDSIYKVEACIQFVGDLAQPETVCMMLKNVAGKDPAVLAEDGKLRIATIKQFISDNAVQTTTILQQTSEEAERIKEEREALSLAYVESCETAQKNYDKELKELQAKLDEELRLIKEQNDSSMAELEKRSRKNAEGRENAQNLNRAINAYGQSMIEKISKLLELITPSDKTAPN